ncbi:hypothetical protein [Streptomyces sp. NPDC058486]|uniref:hypothetical protein n=1 Tax=unclassified Streptomyces TaxID=2593676 RepID=UPI003653CD8C
MLLLVLLMVLIVGFGLAGYGFGRLGQAGVLRADRVTRLRCGAALAGAGAAALYAWGLFGVGMAVLVTEDSGSDAFPPAPCRVAGDPAASAGVTGHRVEYLPPRYVCELRDGGSRVTGDGPGYVGPAVLGLLATAAVCVFLAEAGPSPSARKVSKG